MDPNLHVPNLHGTPFLRVLALLGFALVITLLSSLGTYWYISNQMSQQTLTQQQVYQPAPTVVPTVSNPSVSPTVDETVNIQSLVKDFYNRWIPIFINPSGYPGDSVTKANRLVNEGYLTGKAADSIKQSQGSDLPTCSQNPLKPEEYIYSTPVINGEKATMSVSGTYSGDNSKITMGLDLLKSGTKWMIDGFHCLK